MKKKISFGPFFGNSSASPVRPLTTPKVDINLSGEQLPSPSEHPGDIARQLRIKALSAEHVRLANSNRPADLARCQAILAELDDLTNHH